MGTAKNYRDKLQFEKRLVWMTTLAFAAAAFPLLKNIIVSILVKLYEMIIQHAITS